MAPNPSEQLQLLMLKLARNGADGELLERIAQNLVEKYREESAWVELAVFMRRRRNYAAAESVYRSAFVFHPNSARLWNNLGVLLRDWGKPEDAINAFDRAIAIKSDYANPHAGKGKVFEKAGMFVEARACYRASLAIDPNNAAMVSDVGTCYNGEGDIEQAILWFEKALAIDPAHGDALFNLTALRFRNGELDVARNLAKRLIEILPDDPEVQSLVASVNDAKGKAPKLIADPPRPLGGSELSPYVKQLSEELRGNPKSVFISYAWSSEATKKFAASLSKNLKIDGFQVMLDQEHRLEVHEVLYLLLNCQNVVVLNDLHYAESCLLGKVPVTNPTSHFPSFAFPANKLQSENYLGEVFKVTAGVWTVAKAMHERGHAEAAQFAIDFADPESWTNAPGLRVFIEGWRVDEIQMVFANIRHFRSISVLFLGGEHCLAGYPLFDFSNRDYYSVSLAALVRALEVGQHLTVDDAPIEFSHPDWKTYRWPNSDIVRAKLWRISPTNVGVWRPSITPEGEAAALIQEFRDWEPVPDA